VKTLNGFYAEAEKIGGSSYLEGCLACATAYFIFLCMETHYEKVLRSRGGLGDRHGWWGARGWHREHGGLEARAGIRACKVGHQGWQALSVPLCAGRS